MGMQEKFFNNGQSQAVRLPKQILVEGKAVSIQEIGDSVVLSPIQEYWDSLLEAAADFSPDFIMDREQEHQAEREGL